MLKQPDRTAVKRDAQRPPLLRLPGELRNRIYRMVVLQPETWLVTQSGIGEPPLLLTNHRVRKEAITIFYGENTFAVPIPDYSSSTCLRYTTHTRLLARKLGINITCRLLLGRNTNCPNWGNLIEWLERFHKRETLCRIHKPSEAPDTFPLDRMIVSAMFETVQEMRTLSWAKVKPLLEEHRLVLSKADERWAA